MPGSARRALGARQTRMLLLPGPQALKVVARRAIGRLHFHRHLGVAGKKKKVKKKVTATKSG